MTDKIIAMPTDDEMYTAFTYALQAGVPESKKGILATFEKFLDKAKEHLKKMVLLTDTGLVFNLTEQTGNDLLTGFVSSQGFLMKPLLKGALMMFGADTFTSFIASTKTGKNNKDTTINGLVTISGKCFEKLGEKYATAETSETIKIKVVALFADKA